MGNYFELIISRKWLVVSVFMIIVILSIPTYFYFSTVLEIKYRYEIVDSIIFERLKRTRWVPIDVNSYNAENVVSELNDDEFILHGIDVHNGGLDGFWGESTLKGIIKLKRNLNVTRIQYNYPA